MQTVVTAAFLLPAVLRLFTRRVDDHGSCQDDEKPQNGFGRVLADTTDAPFRHLNGEAGPDANHPFLEDIRQLIENPFASDTVLSSFETRPGPVEYTWVDTIEGLRAVVVALTGAAAVAVDVEHNHTRSYLGTTCLLQLSDGTHDWLVDALALHDNMSLLAPLFRNPAILKVMHGADSDVVWLQRDFHIYCVNVFDTARASPGDPKPLAGLLRDLCGVHTDKGWQLSDWRSRPLPREALQYAATDVHYLLHIAALQTRQVQHLPPSKSNAAPLAAGPIHTAGRLTGQPVSKTGAIRQKAVQSAPVHGRPEGDLSKSAEKPAGSAVDVSNSNSDHCKGAAADDKPDNAQGSGRADLSPAKQRAWERSQRVTLRMYRKPQQETAALAAAQSVLRRCSGQGAPPGGPMTNGGGAMTNGGASVASPTQPSTDVGGSHTAASQHMFNSKRDAAGSRTGRGSKTPSLSLAGASDVVDGVKNIAALQILSPPVTSPTAAGPAEQNSAGSEARVGTAARDCVYALCIWRDQVARELDEGLQFVMTDAAVWQLAVQHPRTASDAAAVVAAAAPTPAGKSTAVLQRCDEVVKVLRDAAAGRTRWPTDHGPPPARAAEANGGSRRWEGRRRDGERMRLQLLPAEERRRVLRERLVRKFAAKEPVYDNCRMLSQAGELLCYCDRAKVEWYLARGLADLVQDGPGPTVIRLRFEHQNNDQRSGMQHFYVQSKANQCVGCGDASHYLRYRVIPGCYRRHFPEALKSHRSHDIVLLCLSCHQRAHTAADRVKLEVVRDYGVPLLPPHEGASATIVGDPLPAARTAAAAAATGRGPLSGEPGGGGGARGSGAGSESEVEGNKGGGDEGGSAPEPAPLPNAVTVRKAAGALLKHRDTMPLVRRRKVEGVVAAFLGLPLPLQQALSNDELAAGMQAGLPAKSREKVRARMPPEFLASLTPGGVGLAEGPVCMAEFGASGHLWHGKEVVDKALQRGGEAELLALGRRFRESFLKAVQPRFLSAKWEVDHSAAREFGPHSIYSAAAADDPGRGEWLQVADPSAYSAGLSSHNTAPHTAHSPSEAGQ